MGQLFKKTRIEKHLEELENSYKLHIDKFGEGLLLGIDVEKTVSSTFEKYKVELPKLETSKTKTSISTKKIQGTEFPSGTPFEMGRIYEIEFVKYEIPYTGDSKLFDCFSLNTFKIAIEADVASYYVILNLTSYSTISGNEHAIEELKNIAIGTVKNIEHNLTTLEPSVKVFNDTLEQKIRNYLNEKIKKITIKNDTIDKLNPFK